ncbi:MAG: anti-sigma factor [Vicinamibacterales bacterium]
MNCPHRSQIDDFIDGALPPADARAFEAHLASCGECGPVVADLRAITATARVLERHAPPPAAWSRIERELGAARGAAPASRTALSLAANWRSLAAAAALVIIAGGISWLGVRLVSVAPTEQAAPAAAAADPALVQSVETQLRLAEEHYANAIAGLDAIAQAEDTALDQDTADVLQANLTVIDAAIGESRAALQANPSSALAQQSLFSALQSKVSLLQNTIALINEMRKGNEAGAARIVSGMNP